MATIISKPSSIAMSGNIKDIIVDSSTEINFEIQEVGGSTILEETYQPDANNKITIRLRDLLPSLLSLQLPTSDVFEQTNAVKNYNFIVEGTAVPTKVVFGGVDADADPEVFLKGNWLTWQPQQKNVKFNDPEWLSYHAVVTAVVKVKAYFKDKDPETITLASLPAGKTYSLNMNFGYLSGKFTGQPVYFDIWNEDTVGTQLAFVQRFVLFNDYFEHEDLFVVDNSLGGLDTFRFTGKKEDINDFEIESALFDEDTMDYDVDFEKYFKKNTGYFPDDRYKVWTQEFFNSLKRYYCADTGYQSITVSKPKAKSVQGDITTYNYDFEFALSRQTKYLNLSRANELPTEVQIVDPDSELFFLAPRLSEFPSAILNSQLLIPVQVPFTEKWGVTNYGAIRTNILSEVAAMGFVSGDEVGSHVDLSAYALVEDLHEHANKAFLDTLALDGNYLESNNGEVWVANADRLGNLEAVNYWTKQELINDSLYLKVGADKIKAGFADLANNSDHLGGIAAADYWNKYNSDISTKTWTMYDAIVHRNFVTSAFAPGIIGGVGAKINQSGHGEMKSLDLREFLRTPELIKNQVRVAGNQFWFTDPGLIQDVSGTGPYTLTLKIEEGDGVSFEVDDILIGIFNHDTGFQTCYLDVVSVDLENNQVVVNSRNGISPRKFMQLARKGNETNTDRQTSVFVDGLNGFVRVLGGVNDHNTTFNNIIAQLGYLNMHSPVFGDMEKGLYVKDFGYFENVRVSGEIHVTGGNAETQTGAQDKADAAEAAATAVASTAQSKADSAYNLADLKITEADAVTITHREIKAPYIATLGLKVGDEILMGENAVISWEKVIGTENVETTSGAQAKVDALVVGGENLLDNSNFSDGFTGWGTWGSPTISEPADKGRRIVKYGYTNGFGAITPRFAAKQGVKYMVSFDAASMYSTSSLNYMYIMKSSGNVSLPGVLIDGSTTQYKRYAFSFISPVTEDISIMFAKVGLGLNDEGFKINNVKIEIGDKATAWTPSLNDVDTNVTSISQNVIATTTVIAESLKVKAANIIDQLTAAQINFDNAVGNNVTLSGKFISNSQTLGAGNIVIDGAHLYRTDGDDDSRPLSVNWYGYNGDTTRYRDFYVYDGRAQYPLLACWGKQKKVRVGTDALPDPVNLEVYGDLDVDGAIHWGTPSDKRLKKRIKTIGNPLKALRKTRPVTFYYKEGEQILHRGFIAQEIQEVFPEFVSKRKDGKLRINTIEMIAQNTAGILQNDTRITLLKKEVEYLKSKLKKHGITY